MVIIITIIITVKGHTASVLIENYYDDIIIIFDGN